MCGCVIDLLKIRLHKCCLQIINKKSLFEAVLEKGSSVSIHNCNLRILPTEMYEIKNDLSPLIVTEFLKKRNEQLYDIRSNARFTILPIRKVYHDSFLGPKIWDILPYILKNSNRIETFKMKTKK